MNEQQYAEFVDRVIEAATRETSRSARDWPAEDVCLTCGAEGVNPDHDCCDQEMLAMLDDELWAARFDFADQE